MSLFPHVAHNSGNNEWYTPSKIIELARATMGGIDFDPASNPDANEVVKASQYKTKDDCGLSCDWFGRVWMNPPYSKGLVERFSSKLLSELASGRVSEAIVLVNNATETTWLQSLMLKCQAVCLLGGRVRFWNLEGVAGSPLQGQVSLYFGRNSSRFYDEFRKIGLVFAPFVGQVGGVG